VVAELLPPPPELPPEPLPEPPPEPTVELSKVADVSVVPGAQPLNKETRQNQQAARKNQ